MTAANSGPILFGHCLDIALCGILTVQTYLYYLAFPKDRRMTKSIVYFVYIVGTLQTAFGLHDFYTLIGTPQGRRKLVSPNFDIHTFGFLRFTIPGGGALLAFTVELFYAHRIYVISKSRVVAALVSILAFVQLVSGIITAICGFQPDRFEGSSVQATMGTVSMPIGPVSGAICDLFIAGYLTCYLSEQMKGTPKATRKLVRKIGCLLAETGTLTAVMAVVYAVLVFLTPYGMAISGLSLGKLHATSMLVLLNNRYTIPGGRNEPHPDSDILSDRHPDLVGANTGPISSRSSAVAHSHPEETALPSSTVIRSGCILRCRGLKD